MQRQFKRAVMLLALTVVGLAGRTTTAQEEAPRPEAEEARVAPAHLVRIPLPIVGSADDRLRRVVTRLLEELPLDGEERPVVVFEFGGASAGDAPSGFERCFALARFLASDSLSAVRTVAFVPQTVKGHDVLPIMACEEIIIAGDAEFGAAGIHEQAVGGALRAAYEEIAGARRTVPPAAALAMLLRDTALLRADTADGVELVLESDLAELQQSTAVKSVDTISPRGDLALLTGRQMRLELGMASHLASDYSELSAALERPLEYVNTSRLLGEEGKAVRIDFDGPPTHQNVNRMIRTLAEAVGRKQADQVVLWIDSSGGSPADSMRLAQYLSQLDSEQVRTIAYVPKAARGDAALVALACDQLVLGEGARLGGAGTRDFSRGERLSLREPIKSLAHDKGVGWSLPMALVDSELDVASYKQVDSPGARVFSQEELEDEPEEKWEMVAPLDLSDGLSAAEALRWRLADDTVGSDEEFLLLHGLPTDLQPLEARWSDVLIDALARDEVAYIMLFIATGMLLVEMGAPGLGIPGFISSVCFALYFWSRFLYGTAQWLEVILFVLGAVFIIVEIFVLPGWGIFGVGGGLLVLAAVVLASQTFIVPTTVYQLEQLPRTLATLLTAMGGVLVGIFLISRVLPHTPGLNKIILPPPEGDELEQIRLREVVTDWSRFLGQEGQTTTPLMPSGKARFGRETIDVMSRGEMIAAGQPVRAVEAVGNRVIVEAVDA